MDDLTNVVKEYSQLGFSYVVAFWLLTKTDKVLQEIFKMLLTLKGQLEQVISRQDLLLKLSKSKKDEDP